MRWWPRRREPERIELHPGVPPLAEWNEHGLVGTIGSGPGAGCTVLAVLYRDEDGAFSAYALDRWDGPDPVLDAAGRFVMETGVAESREPGVEGGLIDALTREVDVEWWTDHERVEAFWAQQRGWFAEGPFPLDDPFCERFLARLRAAAGGWDTDVTPAATIAETLVDPLVVSIQVPGLTRSPTTLWVLCHHRDGAAVELRAWWGDPGRVDDGGRGDHAASDLIAPATTVGADDAADLAAQWFARQLASDVRGGFRRQRLVRTGGRAITQR